MQREQMKSSLKWNKESKTWQSIALCTIKYTRRKETCYRGNGRKKQNKHDYEEISKIIDKNQRVYQGVALKQFLKKPFMDNTDIIQKYKDYTHVHFYIIYVDNGQKKTYR